MSIANEMRSLPRLDSDLLRTVLQVAACGSFSEAATRIHRSQSAVSLQMKQLEDTLGQSLFERHGRGVHTTSDGLIYDGAYYRGERHGSGRCYIPGHGWQNCRWFHGERIERDSTCDSI